MNCENNFCIYCDNDKCILDEINIDNTGMCGACIRIDLDDDILKSAKKKILDRYQEEYTKWGSY